MESIMREKHQTQGAHLKELMKKKGQGQDKESVKDAEKRRLRPGSK